MGTSTAKQSLGFSHNCAPRDEISNYGEAMVKEWELRGGWLDIVKRMETAHASSSENFSLLVGSLVSTLPNLPGVTSPEMERSIDISCFAQLFRLYPGLPALTINASGAACAIVRIAMRSHIR